jgi:O-antigen ligase
VLVFALALLWGMLRAAVLADTLVTVARLSAGLTALYLVVDYAERPSRLWNVAAALLLAGIFIAFASPLVKEPTQDMFNASFLFRADRVRVDASNPDVVAGVLVLLIPLALALLTHAVKRFQILGALALPPFLIMLALLQAHNAWVAAGSSILLFASLSKRWILALVPTLVLALILLILFGESLNLPTVSSGATTVTGLLEGRQRIWEFAARQIVREPSGLGFNSFTRYAENLAGDYLTELERDHAHNLFLQVGVELGLIGLGAFAALYAYALYASWHAVRRGIKRNQALGIFVALVVALFSGLFEVNLWGNTGALLLWVLIGMAVVLGRYGARERERRHGKRPHAKAYTG